MSTFKDFLKEYCPNGVEHKKLGEVFNLRNGYTPSTKNEAFWKNGNLPWFTMKDLRANGRILSDSIEHITCEGVRGSLFPKDSIILATTATIGEHALITTDFLCNQRFTAFSAKPQYATRLLPMYAFYCFFSVDEWCKKHIAASTFPSISTDMLRDLEIPLPPSRGSGKDRNRSRRFHRAGVGAGVGAGGQKQEIRFLQEKTYKKRSSQSSAQRSNRDHKRKAAQQGALFKSPNRRDSLPCC